MVQEMEAERQALEAEEKLKAERMKKVTDQFTDETSQWERDKSDIKEQALREKNQNEVAAQLAAERRSDQDS